MRLSLLSFLLHPLLAECISPWIWHGGWNARGGWMRPKDRLQHVDPVDHLVHINHVKLKELLDHMDDLIIIPLLAWIISTNK